MARRRRGRVGHGLRTRSCPGQKTPGSLTHPRTRLSTGPFRKRYSPFIWLLSTAVYANTAVKPGLCGSGSATLAPGSVVRGLGRLEKERPRREPPGPAQGRGSRPQAACRAPPLASRLPTARLDKRRKERLRSLARLRVGSGGQSLSGLPGPRGGRGSLRRPGADPG